MMYLKLISSSRHPHFDTTKYNMILRTEQGWKINPKPSFVPAIRKHISLSSMNSWAPLVGILEAIDLKPAWQTWRISVKGHTNSVTAAIYS